MAEFYPSEIARLVLGYLKEIQCLESWQVFLDECADLQEHKRLYKDGKFCTTNVNGKSLLDILAEYCALKNSSKENSQNKCSTNTYQVYGVYKTPSKNESAYASYSINQRIQTRSVVSSIKSPRYNLFRSPTSRPSCQTPRRRLECQSTNLNFGPEAQAPSEKDATNSVNQSQQILLISTSSNTQTCKSSPLVSKDNMCFSSPSVSVCPDNQDKRKGLHSEPTKSKIDENHNSEKEHFLSSEDISSQLPNASESGIGEKSDTPDGKCSAISELKIDKQKSSTTVTCDAAIAQPSGKSIVCRSSEITTENISLTLSENCSTPQYEVEPPPYNRAPDTNSPRIVLSHDRSLVPSLSTPSKDKKLWPEEEWSPKRKGAIPRRRLITESPASKQNQQPEAVITFDSVIENLFGPDEALFNDPLVQLLTENINKVKQCELMKESDFEGLDDLVKKAAESTEEDPAFEKFLVQMCGNSKDSDHFNVENTPLKLTDTEWEKISDEKKNNQKEIADKTLNNELNQEAAQNFTSNSKLEKIESTSAEEIRDSNNDNPNEPLNVLENNLNSSVVNFNMNQKTSSDSQPFLNSDMNSQLNSTFESYLSKDKTVTTGSVNKPNDLSSNLPANNNSDKDLQSSEISSVVAVDNQTSSVSPIPNNVVLNSNNISSQEEIKNTEMGNQSINFDAHNTPQTDNSVTAGSISNQPTSTAQMTSSSQMIPQLVSQPPQMTTQTNALIELPLPSLPAIFMPTLNPDGTVQGNLYRFVINTPVFNPSPVSGIGLPLQTAPTQNVTSPLIVTSTPTVPLLKKGNVGKRKNIENSVVTPESSKTLIIDIASSDKELTPKETTPNRPKTPLKKRRRISKRQKPTINYSESCISSPSSSGSTKSSKRNNKKQSSKRKPLRLFPDSPSLKVNKNIYQTPAKDSENDIPVISIPSPTNQSSAFKLLSQITGQYERGDRSPVLKSLMSKAAVLSDKKSLSNSTHVRHLDFNSNSNAQNKNNDSVNSIKMSKASEPVLEKSETAFRRSSRIQQQKIEEVNDSVVTKLTNVQQSKNKLKVNSFAISSSNNQVKDVESNDFNSPMFSKALDVFNCVDDTQIFDIDMNLELTKSKDSHIVSGMPTNDHLLSKEAGIAKENEQYQQREIEVIELNKSDNSVNLKENASLSSTSPKKNNFSGINNLNSPLKEKKEIKISDKKIENIKNDTNMKDNKDINKSKKLPLQSKGLSTVKNMHNNSCVSLPTYRNSELSEKQSPNNQSEKDMALAYNSDKDNSEIVAESVSPKPCKSDSTRLHLLLFGSDNEFTPEKDSNPAIQASNITIMSPSVTTNSTTNITKSVNSPAIESTSHASKCKIVSPKMLSSSHSKQSLKCDNDKLSSSLSSSSFLVTNASVDIQCEKIENISNVIGKGQKIELPLEIITTAKNGDPANVEKNSHLLSEELKVPCVKDAALSKDKSVLKNKTPQKKSLESIVSFCKEKEGLANKCENQINNFNSNQQLENSPNSNSQKIETSVTVITQCNEISEIDKLFLTLSGANNGGLAEKDNSQNQNIPSKAFKMTNVESDKVLPPPKKRIRPIPVDSSSNESFSSPFTQFLSSPNITKSACTTSSKETNHLNVSVPSSGETKKRKFNEIRDIPIINLNDQSSVAKPSVTSFISPTKQSATDEADSSSIKLMFKSSLSSPKLLSSKPTFKQPSLWRSGKPRAMAEIYKNAFPNKASELPISPVAFSNSSSTFDAFSAKRKLLEDSLSEASKEIISSEYKEVPKNVSLNTQENCDFNTDLAHSEKTAQQKKENVALQTQKTGSEVCETSVHKIYSSSHLVKNISSKNLIDNGDNDNKERKRNKSGDSVCSDTCSTVVDFDDDIMTPIKSDDWLKKDLFKMSPVSLNRTRQTSSSSYESDISPEKECHQTNLSYESKERNAQKVPLRFKRSKNFITCTFKKFSNTKLDTNAIPSSSDVNNSNVVGISEPDILSTNVNVSKISENKKINEQQKESESTYSNSKKKRASSGKKERQSRPTLKKTPLNSLGKRINNDKKQNHSLLSSGSKKPSIKKTITKEDNFAVASKNNESYVKSVKGNVESCSKSYKKGAKCKRDKSTDTEKEKVKNNADKFVNAAKTVLEKDLKLSITANQNSVISPQKSIATIDHCETTQDIVESDIGRSSDAGSELSIAIASCERELINSQTDEGLQSPKFQPSFELSEPKSSEIQKVNSSTPAKVVPDGSKLD